MTRFKWFAFGLIALVVAVLTIMSGVSQESLKSVGDGLSAYTRWIVILRALIVVLLTLVFYRVTERLLMLYSIDVAHAFVASRYRIVAWYLVLEIILNLFRIG